MSKQSHLDCTEVNVRYPSPRPQLSSPPHPRARISLQRPWSPQPQVPGGRTGSSRGPTSPALGASRYPPCPRRGSEPQQPQGSAGRACVRWLGWGHAVGGHPGRLLSAVGRARQDDGLCCQQAHVPRLGATRVRRGPSGVVVSLPTWCLLFCQIAPGAASCVRTFLHSWRRGGWLLRDVEPETGLCCDPPPPPCQPVCLSDRGGRRQDLAGGSLGATELNLCVRS